MRTEATRTDLQLIHAISFEFEFELEYKFIRRCVLLKAGPTKLKPRQGKRMHTLRNRQRAENKRTTKNKRKKKRKRKKNEGDMTLLSLKKRFLSSWVAVN